MDDEEVTPGPWRVVEGDCQGTWYIVRDTGLSRYEEEEIIGTEGSETGGVWRRADADFIVKARNATADPAPTDPVPSEPQPLTAEDRVQDTNILSLSLLIKATRTQVLSNQDREDAYEALLALQALIAAKDAEIARLHDVIARMDRDKDVFIDRLMEAESERDELRRQIKAFTDPEDTHENMLAKAKALGWL